MTTPIRHIPIQEKTLFLIPFFIFLFLGPLPRSIMLLNELCLGTMFLLMIRNPHFVRYIFNHTALPLISLAFFLTLNALMNGLSLIFFIKLYDNFKGIIYLLMIIYWKKNKEPAALESFFKKELYYLLIFSMAVNCVVMYYQNLDEYIDYDNICGLTGTFNTGLILILFLACIISTIYVILTQQKRFYYAILPVIILASCYFSTIASIRAFWVFAPYIFIITTLPLLKKTSLKLALISTSLISIFLFFINFNINIETNILSKVTPESKFTGETNPLEAKNEKLGYLQFALSQDKAFVCGNGFGIRSEIANVYGKEYYQQPIYLKNNETSLLIYEAGLGFYISFITLIFILFKMLYKKTMHWFFLSNIVLFSSYTPLFEDERKFYLFVILNSYIALSYKAINNKQTPQNDPHIT